MAQKCCASARNHSPRSVWVSVPALDTTHPYTHTHSGASPDVSWCHWLFPQPERPLPPHFFLPSKICSDQNFAAAFLRTLPIGIQLSPLHSLCRSAVVGISPVGSSLGMAPSFTPQGHAQSGLEPIRTHSLVTKELKDGTQQPWQESWSQGPPRTCALGPSGHRAWEGGTEERL